MNGPKNLEERVGKLVTRMGAVFPGDRTVFRGHDLHSSLQDLDWMELYLFGITGRLYTKQQVKVFNILWSYTSYPDARLWNNRVAALAGTARSTGTLGIGAAMAVSEAQVYGWGAALRASEFLIRAKSQVDAGIDLKELVRAELKQHRGIGGYGRPIVSEDERIVPVMAMVREQGLGDGPHLKLAFEVENILLDGRWRMRMNHAALTAALTADFGLSPQEYYLYGIPAFLAGMPPCYLDAAEKPEGQLFPMPCRMLSYEGVSQRGWNAVKETVRAVSNNHEV